jgi:ATP-binding cassette subfamily B protein
MNRHPGPRRAAPQRPRGQISLDRVSFSYDRYSVSVLREVTARIEPGTRVAIVGASGAGKTALALLILGFYQPTGGTVRFDGTDLASADPRLVRARVGSVLQDAFVFSGTIADNIALHDPAITPAAIERAARLACLHDDIAGLPQGYATRIGEHGGGLSGGQRQRLAIARALAREPAVLLLDEATSHLDAATESALHANLAGLDCTQIIIAHRLSTVRDADQILVLHDGQLAEHGTHDTLLAVGGRYAALVAAQLNGDGASAGALTMAAGNSTGPAPVRQ